MIGFVVGTVCLIGLVKVLRAGRHGRWGHGFGGIGRGLRGRGFGPRAMMRRLFLRLDTSPSQEKVLVEAATELFGAAEPLREELVATRREVARALRSPSLDEVALGELFARHDEVLRDLRKRTVGALARVHDTLDDRQRESLADALVGGFRGPGRGGSLGPYRGGVAI